MDERTQDYYSKNYKEIAARYKSAEPNMKKILGRAFFEGMRILDVGAGSGRDMHILLEMGCDVYGIEPCDELRETSVILHPHLENRICAGQLPRLGKPFGGQFDGVLCSAVIMHLTKAEMLDAAISI
jgi:2-polyprenyl-3-methyl-5-hydroxy-6-metoxy-1,4-benzoquinol methylase